MSQSLGGVAEACQGNHWKCKAASPVCLVYLVHLVSFVQPNPRDRPNRLDRLNRLNEQDGPANFLKASSVRPTVGNGRERVNGYLRCYVWKWLSRWVEG
jgi:hypothetical protein